MENMSLWAFRILGFMGLWSSGSLLWSLIQGGESFVMAVILFLIFLFLYIGSYYPKRWNTVSWILILTVGLSGLMSVGNSGGWIDCALNEGGVPTCYVAFGIFVLMSGFWIWHHSRKV